MIDIRPIQLHEGDEFLRLLCTVFDLDFSKARDVFYRDPFFELTRKWGLFEAGSLSACLTTVPLRFADGPAVGIAGVATTPMKRRRRLASKLINEVLSQGKTIGEDRALLFAKDRRLYEQAGFKTLDDVVSQPLQAAPAKSSSQRLLGAHEVKEIYDQWSSNALGRLIRDERRWHYWSWNMKTAFRQADGYVCYEFGRVRELLPQYDRVPFDDPAEWYGLRSLALALNLGLDNARQETFFMGRGFDYIPQMFLTDQF